jgi:hypothetical protein
MKLRDNLTASGIPLAPCGIMNSIRKAEVE